MKKTRHSLGSQNGVIGIAALAIALPIMLLLLAALTDLLRPESVASNLQGVFQRVSTSLTSRLNPAETTKLTGYHLPAGRNLTGNFTDPMPAAELEAGGSTTRVGVIDPDGSAGAQSVVDLACSIAAQSLDGIASRANFLTQAGGAVRYAFQFGVVGMVTDGPDTGAGLSFWATSADSPACAGQDFSALAQELQLNVSVASVVTEFGSRLSNPSGYTWDGGGTSLLPVPSFALEDQPDRGSILPSIWLVGVAIAETTGLMGDLVAPQKKVVETYVFNLGSPFGWQSSTPYVPEQDPISLPPDNQ